MFTPGQRGFGLTSIIRADDDTVFMDVQSWQQHALEVAVVQHQDRVKESRVKDSWNLDVWASSGTTGLEATRTTTHLRVDPPTSFA